MELSILNSTLETIGFLDVFESLIWTDRYYGCGDFEIFTPITSSFQNLYNGSYLTRPDSDRVMVLEPKNIKTNLENGNRIIVSGRSLESILDRRIIWNPTNLNGNFQDSIFQLLDENAINPDDGDRAISLLEFEASTDPAITALTVKDQFTGTILYDAILNLCLSKNVGFKITLTDLGKFKFKLYFGVDRSYSQSSNPYVVFSPDFENLANSDYLRNDKPLKTITLVAGEEGVGNTRRMISVSCPSGAGSDLARREMFSDAKDVTRMVSGEEPLSDEEYDAHLTQRGKEDLAKNVSIQNFEGEIDNTSRTYICGVDFELGDIVQIVNEYGIEARSRVLEAIYSEDLTGIKIYPTFGIP